MNSKLSVGHPVWVFLPVGILPAFLFVVRAWTATDGATRKIWLVNSMLILVLAGFGVFSRVVVNGERLSVPYNIFGRRAVRLDRLTRVAAEQRPRSRRRRGAQDSRSMVWVLILHDSDGRSVKFTLNGVRVADRERLLSLISRYAEETMAEKIGPFDEVIALSPWFPSPRTTGPGR